MKRYAISFYTRSQSTKGQTKDYPVVNLLVSHTKFKGRKFRYSTGVVIHKKLWKDGGINGKALESAAPPEAQSFFRPATHKDGDAIKLGYRVGERIVQGTVLAALDQRLKDLRRKVEVWMDYKALESQWSSVELKKFLDSDKPVKIEDQIDVFKKWEEIINNTLTKDKEPIKEGTRNAKMSTLARVKEYFGDKAVTFESFNQEFYNSFMRWMTLKEMKKNTRGKHIKEIKSVLRRAMEDGLPVSMAFLNSKNFKTLKEDTDQVYLTEDELMQVYKLKLPAHLERIKDAFVSASYVGARFGDWDKINFKNVVKDNGVDILRYESTKTKIKCSVQLHPIVNLILKKYNGELPLISNQKTNEALKEIADKAKLGVKIKEIGTHTARRNFCTNAYLNNVPIPIIMNASGHQSEQIFKKYVRLDDLQKAVHHAKSDKSGFFNAVVMEVAS